MAEREEKEKNSGDENQERGNWSSQFDFLLSTIGFAVGLGNVWRFPYKAYEGGGASFLIPYVVFLVTAGLPLFFLEMGFGQFASLGPVSVWNASPMFRGLGWAMVIICGLVCIYYNMVIAYTIHYIFSSFAKDVPWADCDSSWPPEYGCKRRSEDMSDNETTTFNLTTLWCKENYDPSAHPVECTVVFNPKSPSQVYWEHEVLDQSSGIDEGAGDFKWELVLCLLAAWIVVFVCLSRGIKSSGKVVYVTATLPYIVLIILLIRNVTLEGAWGGIEYYVIPDMDKLKDAAIWYSAASQIFYSLGVSFGSLQTLSSYNRFRNNVYRDAILVACVNCCTSILAGFVIFAVLGHMAHKNGVPIEDVAKSGPGLAFEAYPEGIALLPVSPAWSILFFVMLLSLGLDSQFAMMETVITAIVDEFKWWRKSNRKLVLTLICCIVLFLLGLPQCARNGVYIMNLFDWYSAGYSLFSVALLEVIAIGWVYGVTRFIGDLEMILGKKPKPFWGYWFACWTVVTPVMLLFILIYSSVNYGRVTLNSYVYPKWADNIGFGMVGLALIFVPVCAFLEYCKASQFLVTMKKVLRPKAEWGPALPQHREGIYDLEPPPQYNGTSSKTTFDNLGYEH